MASERYETNPEQALLEDLQKLNQRVLLAGWRAPFQDWWCIPQTEQDQLSPIKTLAQ